MRLHLVTVPPMLEGESSWRVFCGTGAEATAERIKFYNSGAVKKKSDITIEQVDVPTDKGGLLAYLNALVGG
jgi:hypothetical protein